VSSDPEPAVGGSQAQPKLDMSSEAGRDAARGAQDELTQNVGRRLTLESHETGVRRWKRWLGKR